MLGKNLYPLIICFVSFALLLGYHVAPGISFHDSGEFALAAVTAGTTHPPGAPTWVILNSLWLRLLNFSEPAYGTNIMSALLGAVTLTTLFASVRLWGAKAFPSLPQYIVLTCALGSTLVLFHSGAFLEQSFITEQYTLLTALNGIWFYICIFLLSRLYFEDHPPQVLPKRLFLAAGLIWGLSIGNHPSQICLIIPTLLIFVLIWKNGFSFKQIFLFAMIKLVGLIIGLSTFVWLWLTPRWKTLFDSVDCTNWERFLWAIKREKWGKRSWSEAPDYFTVEWLKTYNLIGELGLVGFLLMLVAIPFLFKKKGIPLLLSLAISIPYTLGLYVGHLGQQEMGIDYLRIYGVSDWHLPVYVTGAFFAGFSLLLIFRKISSLSNFTQLHQRIVMGGILLVLSLTGFMSLSNASLKNNYAPQNFIENTLKPLSQECWILPSTDNLQMMLGYDLWKNFDPQQPLPERKLLFGSPYPYWHFGHEKDYLNKSLTTKNQNIALRKYIDKAPSFDENIYVSYNTSNTTMTKRLLPAGYLCLFTADEVTSEQVRIAEKEWRSKYPELLVEPTENSHRLERDNYAVLFWLRASYFLELELYDLALEEYKRSIKWSGQIAATWFGLGYCLEILGAPYEAVKTAYETSFQVEPWEINARLFLAAYEKKLGNKEKALNLIQEILKRDPRHSGALELQKDLLR